MQSSSGVFVLPPGICQQLLAMPLTADERNDVGQALLQFLNPLDPQMVSAKIQNAPKPGWLRGA